MQLSFTFLMSETLIHQECQRLMKMQKLGKTQSENYKTEQLQFFGKKSIHWSTSTVLLWAEPEKGPLYNPTGRGAW